jgi:hypothetical protein
LVVQFITQGGLDAWRQRRQDRALQTVRDPTAYTIELVNIGGVNDYDEYMAAAAARWQQVIVGDVPDQLNFPLCESLMPLNQMWPCASHKRSYTDCHFCQHALT